MNLFDQLAVETPSIPSMYKEMTRRELEDRAIAVKQKLGARVFLPGHHYQKDEVIQFADTKGDSLVLAQQSALQKEAESIIFLGVHFMAETADILTGEHQRVYLPDMRAGCSMADMATKAQTEKAWEKLNDVFGDSILPLTYVNSTAAIKAFVGRHGGATVTSSNAAGMVKWAFTQKQRILFLPDQHLGRNTAYDLGVPLENMAVWDPMKETLLFDGDWSNIQVILWRGHCSVHENFTPSNIAQVRKDHPEMHIIVHPECTREVVARSDSSGSTNFIIQTIEQAPPGSAFAIGTEMNLVKRIIKDHPDKHIISLNPNMCPCLTMNRIDLPHLLWSLEALDAGQEINRITVDKYIANDAKKALSRMLERV
ncbi:quinolinate synthase NadA [Bacillus sp. SB49]|uniref:quinolinate synthase NadA n=1 Tax=Bacillaceae TaxID=186817 RepID=UPI0003F9777A|nr:MULTISPECIES: quinolinate synthase NadA [Bacillaceae]QHT45271.1 quinolinate synthase NadA [Bacillus sp. SB49]